MTTAVTEPVTDLEVAVGPLEEADVPAADQVFRRAFGTMLGLPEPLRFGEGAEMVRSRWHADPSAAFAARVGGELVGCAFVARWGSFAIFGPLAVHPDFWDRGVGKRLWEARLPLLDRWGTTHAGLFTRPDSTKHVHLYQKFGFCAGCERLACAVASSHVLSSRVAGVFPVALTKRCRHGRGKPTHAARLKAWRACGCTWYGDLYDRDGHRVFARLGPDERAARVLHARLLADILEGREVRRRPGRAFREVADDWLAMKTASPEARDNSVMTYKSRIRHLVAFFGDRDIGEVSVDHVRRFLERMAETKAAPATRAGIYAALRSVLGHAQDLGLIATLPLPRHGVEGVRPRAVRLSVADAERAIAAMTGGWAQAAELVLLTGLRIGEVQGLTAGDVDTGRVHVRRTIARSGRENDPKTETSVRAVPLSPRAEKILAGRVEKHPEGRLWPGRYAEALEALTDALETLGLHQPGMGWHALRKAHSALLEDAGLSVRDAAARMGHGANTAQTLAYQWRGELGTGEVVDEARVRHSASREEG